MSAPLRIEAELPLPLEIKYTRRKGSIALQVHPDKIKVLAPQGTRQPEIEQLLQQRHDWLQQVAAKQRQRPDSLRQYLQDEPWLVAGQHCQLELEYDGRLTEPEVYRHGNQLVLRLQHDRIDQHRRRDALQQWYQQQAEALWPQRLQHWAYVTGLTPKRLLIRPYKSRWGSCSAAGDIRLNTLLAMAPERVLDYVIVHELCHLRHLDHSPAFWQLVEQFCPNPKQHRRWLRQHSEQLRF